MNKDNMTLLGIGGALAAIGGLFWWKKKQAPKPAAAASYPAATPQVQRSPAIEMGPVNPGPIQDTASYQDTPPEQWTQEQASQATSDAGNQARDAVGKVFGF